MPVAKQFRVEVDPDLTEMVDIEPERVDGVVQPANGFPALLIKAVNPPGNPSSAGPAIGTITGCANCANCDCGCCANCMMGPAQKAVNAQGGITEKPDIGLAEQVLQLLAKLIQNEAAEMAVGAWDENYDIQLLSEAVSLMCHFRQMESYGDDDDGDGMAKEVMSSFLAKRKVSAAERKRLAGEGNALSDGSYPIANAEDLHNAAILARSGHGDVAAAKRLIAKRARELGVANPLADHAEKETQETTEAVESQEGGQEAAVKAAVAEAMKSHEEALTELRDELAKVKATPIPGGPLMTVPAPIRAQRERDEQLAKAAHYRRLAGSVSEQDLRNYYEKQASAAEAAARA